jgi:hypothetical protein
VSAQERQAYMDLFRLRRPDAAPSVTRQLAADAPHGAQAHVLCEQFPHADAPPLSCRIGVLERRSSR